MEQQVYEGTNEQQVIIESIFLCEKGRVRTKNEDSIAVLSSQDHGLPMKGSILIVADGLGGMEEGERASSLVTSELPSLYLASPSMNSLEALTDAVQEVNRRVYEVGRSSLAGKGMATTIVAAVVIGNRVATINVGDSRAYLLHRGKLRQLTVDHTLRRPFFTSFSRRSRHASHILTQAIGPRPSVSPFGAVTSMGEHDLLLLCSDGLTSVLSDTEIEHIIMREKFEDTVNALRDEVYKREGDDNISIIVSRIAGYVTG